jgi:hypothetical protein
MIPYRFNGVNYFCAILRDSDGISDKIQKQQLILVQKKENVFRTRKTAHFP